MMMVLLDTDLLRSSTDPLHQFQRRRASVGHMNDEFISAMGQHLEVFPGGEVTGCTTGESAAMHMGMS